MNDCSQGTESSKDFYLHNDSTTPAKIDAVFSSPEDDASTESRALSSSTRLSSPSPTRSSGSPDSGYSTIELEPGARALSLARLAVRVREGRGEEVVAALHLVARLLDGTWTEEEAKVCLITAQPSQTTVPHQAGSQIAPLLVESYNAEETQVRKAALTCLVSLCLQVTIQIPDQGGFQRWSTSGGWRPPCSASCRASRSKKEVAISSPSQVLVSDKQLSQFLPELFTLPCTTSGRILPFHSLGNKQIGVYHV